MAKSKKLEFNPARVAYFEANGWRAYYERRWLKLLRLIVALSHEQFRIPYPMALVAAYYVTRASAAWAPLNHDEGKVRAFYEKFYRIARRYSGLQFDPAEVARLELKYNDDHRRLVGKPDKSAFIQTMTELHSAIFGISLAQAKPSAEWRVRANNTVDLITGKTSTDVPGDWRKLENLLRQGYQSIKENLSDR